MLGTSELEHGPEMGLPAWISSQCHVSSICDKILDIGMGLPSVHRASSSMFLDA